MHTIKRLVFIGFVPLICALPVFPQEGSAPVREDNLYSVALFASIAEMEKSWGHMDDSVGGSRIRTDYRRMIVEKEPEITGDLPSKLGNYRIEYLGDQALIEKCKTVRKGFAFLKISPIRNEGTRLKIRVAVYWIEYEKSKAMHALSDWSDVEFRYDCEKQSFVVTTVKLGGI